MPSLSKHIVMDTEAGIERQTGLLFFGCQVCSGREETLSEFAQR